MKKKMRKLMEGLASSIETQYPFLSEAEQADLLENYIYRSILKEAKKGYLNPTHPDYKTLNPFAYPLRGFKKAKDSIVNEPSWSPDYPTAERAKRAYNRAGYLGNVKSDYMTDTNRGAHFFPSSTDTDIGAKLSHPFSEEYSNKKKRYKLKNK